MIANVRCQRKTKQDHRHDPKYTVARHDSCGKCKALEVAITDFGCPLIHATIPFEHTVAFGRSESADARELLLGLGVVARLLHTVQRFLKNGVVPELDCSIIRVHSFLTLLLEYFDELTYSTGLISKTVNVDALASGYITQF